MNKGFEIKNLNFSYRKHKFSFEVENLFIEKGKLTCVIGPNGSGKSTFLKICSGLIDNYKGFVSLYNKKLNEYNKKNLAKLIGFLPQEIDRGKNYKVEDIVMMGRYPHQGRSLFYGERDYKAVRDCLEQTGALKFLKREFSNLSGGEKKRVLIASVLSQESEFLIFDEPGASLDISGEAEIFSLLWTISQKGKGVIIATHNINLASIFADSIILFKDGKLLKKGGYADVITKEFIEYAYGKNIELIDHPVIRGRKFIIPKAELYEKF